MFSAKEARLILNDKKNESRRNFLVATTEIWERYQDIIEKEISSALNNEKDEVHFHISTTSKTNKEIKLIGKVIKAHLNDWGYKTYESSTCNSVQEIVELIIRIRW